MVSVVFLAGRGFLYWCVWLSVFRPVHSSRICLLRDQEGLFTTVFGIVSWFFIPATPADVPFLTQAEKDTYVRALVQDWSGDADADGQATEVFSWSEVWSTFTDAPHVLLLCLPLFFNGVTVSLLYGALRKYTALLTLCLALWDGKLYANNRERPWIFSNSDTVDDCMSFSWIIHIDSRHVKLLNRFRHMPARSSSASSAHTSQTCTRCAVPWLFLLAS